jgi:hypothetical protein
VNYFHEYFLAQLIVHSSDVETFFQPSIDCIVNVVMEQRKLSESPISVCQEDCCMDLGLIVIQHVVLVGGFAASDWLFENVQSSLVPVGLNVIRPENHVRVSHPHSLFFKINFSI